MASRRDELNAYTFAKRRLVAQFLQPNPSGTEEGAPKPLRAVMPGAIVGVVVLAVFGAWGMFKPVAPPGWDKPGENVIVADESTTRYVVLKTGDKVQLHPVLNMASAKLLLRSDADGKVVTVKEKLLDNSKLRHGPTIGIPYAPDRLPSADDAGQAKRWAVCERPGAGGRDIEKAAFVLAEREQHRTDGKQRLKGGQLLYVEDADQVRYLVDAKGVAYQVDKADRVLMQTLVGSGSKPQRVSDEWLATLDKGDPVRTPALPDRPGTASQVPGGYKVGTVLRTGEASEQRQYVVLKDRLAPVSDFMAEVLLNSKALAVVGQGGEPKSVGVGELGSEPGAAFDLGLKWPQDAPDPVNEAGSRDTVCSVLRGVDRDTGETTLSTWAGESFPMPLSNGGSSAYVTPGTGLLFRQVMGEDTKSGPMFLVTDTGLRYAMQANGDTATDDAGIGESGSAKEREEQQAQQQDAQSRLDYEGVEPTPVPAAWSTFLPTGPRLSAGAARQPQGS
ncbi:type VII secretion protein EccB [Streptomyces sp. TRM66268-LWL]|uniref:Type VII secretion protein EccB n=1 Tax=Streptomyces polyasparticus TaxID=2767826 RepID=A0ABR7S9Y2_9ACTN|nr:type VII secretion protein EccB [Streptomyces polyasparticus]MBC9711767.1 type VII secretion protein EccB [Streptomyces polyasparticus]